MKFKPLIAIGATVLIVTGLFLTALTLDLIRFDEIAEEIFGYGMILIGFGIFVMSLIMAVVGLMIGLWLERTNPKRRLWLIGSAICGLPSVLYLLVFLLQLVRAYLSDP